jgi:outer membrane receptor protein involved in Fe transport
MRCILLCWVLVAWSLPALSQSGVLRGAVVDSTSGDPLPGVSVSLRGTARGTTTDLQGRYEFGGLPEGACELEATLIGYQPLVQRAEVRAGAAVALDLRLVPRPIHLSEMLVHADRAASAASAQAVREFDLQIRPRASAQQLLQLAPGLVIAQHAGGGKAEQLYLRGFDCDHGTDVAVSVDGMPVNMVSHGHGQGYADLHFLIPETVEGMDVAKGPYLARHGNLATAGAVSFRTRDHLEENLIRVGVGQQATAHYTALYQLPLADPDQTAYAAGEYRRTDGPVHTPQDFQRLNLFAKMHTHLSDRATLTLDASGFSSAWESASGQIPARALPLIGRWGAIDDLEGGATGRRNLNLTFREQGRNNSDLTIQTYLVGYDFKLFSNFTFFLEDPEAGDMIEQTDDRRIWGLDSRYTFFNRAGPFLAQTTLGGGFRADDIRVGLWHAPDRRRRAPRVDSQVLERNLSLWAQQEVFLGPRLRLIAGLRGDYFTFSVEDHLELQPASLPHASGYAHQGLLSPKATLVYSPSRRLDLFANFGTGFHSNDGRAVVIGQRVRQIARRLEGEGRSSAETAAALEAANYDPGQLDTRTLPRALGGELGARARLWERLNLGAAAWWLDLDREYVYVGDEGTTELSGRTRRLGLDLEARLQLRPWLWADADANLSRGQARDEPAGADEIPLAPTLTSTGGLTARHPGGCEGSLRYRRVGERPANEDNSVRALGYTVVDLAAGYRLGAHRLDLYLENLLDAEWNEAQFATESHLRNEAEPVEELHFTPGNPRTLRLELSRFF